MTDFAAQFAALAAEVAGIDAAASARLEAELRNRHGGQQIRISSRPPQGTMATIERINAGLHQREPVTKIAADLGVSRATIYRRLKPRKSHAKKT